MSGLVIDICLFAHNEAERITSVLGDLVQQSLLANDGTDWRLVVMANGCSDDTTAVAERWKSEQPERLAHRIEIATIQKSGKSRSWNIFTHQLLRPDAQQVIFMDADIRLVDPRTIQMMSESLAARSELKVYVSRPVKDIQYYNLKVGPVAWLINQGGGMLDDYRTSISGQLYVIRSETARSITMPIGLPVEDGFLREMILTDLLSRPEEISRIDGRNDVFHVYESLRTVRQLLRHQTRIVIGSAINAALFASLRRKQMSFDEAKRYLRAVADDEDWLRTTLKAELPRAPFGYVPFHFLHKRLNIGKRTDIRMSAKTLLMTAVGFSMDAVVYVLATIRMTRGQGVGYW
ncbi:glycosyl transferase group 2 family protein [Hyphomicrobium methylovorum]|uniref:glycosyltransferase family A protein n=1 Tax=Hyphomicrobium methylovorum TaxID=84 RepID=UPI0015E7C268|nr:glycosyltransferase family A protein [Hyphomicrobium methylovorum]MBA2127590.1 glycosyl transferase group 2 family protein [Hyphomicrobium methylovorum]